MRSEYLAATLVAAIAMMSASADSTAATRERSFVQNATGACQSALPVFDGQIRKRPLAVQNEGTASAFVTCSFNSTDRGVGNVDSIKEVLLYADNNTGVPVMLSCTLVDAYSGGFPLFVTKTITMQPHSDSNEFRWNTADNSGNNFFMTVNTSCNLPVGTGLSIAFVYFDEDVGS